MKTIEDKAKAYDKVRKKIAIRFGSNVADEFFAEFEGSKDEEIRKALLEMVHDTTGDELWVDYNVHKEEALAWLEKQGQVKESTISQHEIETCKENGNSLTYEDEKARKAIMALIEWSKSYSASGITNDDAKKMLSWLERQGEQKSQRTISAEAKEALFDYENANIKQKDFAPKDEQKPEENKGNIGGISSNWSEEDERMLDSVRISINEESIAQGLRSRGDSYRIEDLITIRSKQINWLHSLQDRVQPQPKQEWSEEEIEPIISDYLCGREHYGGMIGRLCHLKPKQKQTEWGEDDKAFLDDILCKLEHDLILNKDEKDWLKSLRPQPQWKPSDNELEVLRLVAEKDGTCLMGLYEQLKKLKE